MDDIKCNSLKCRKSLQLELGRRLQVDANLLIELNPNALFLYSIRGREYYEMVGNISLGHGEDADLDDSFAHHPPTLAHALPCACDIIHASTLDQSAVVTTCSHIFCVECANSLFSVPQICPACDTALPDADDVVQTTLNPPDSYKTSVLSGLHPSIILDIASRALNFHTYQTQQEAAFQALVTRNTQERIAVLENQMSSIMRDANSEITLLKEKVAETERDLELERRRIRDLHETHKANAKAYNKLKAQYDKEKQRNLLPSSERHPSNTFEAAAAAIAGNTTGARQPFAVTQGVSAATPARSHSTSSLISQPDRGWSASAQRNHYAKNAQKLGGGDAGAGGMPFAYNPGDSAQRPRNAFQGDHTQLHNSSHAPQQHHGAAMKGPRQGRNHSTGSGSTGSESGGRHDHFAQAFQGQNSARDAGQHRNTGIGNRTGGENLPQFLGQPLPSPGGGAGGGGQPGQKPKGASLFRPAPT